MRKLQDMGREMAEKTVGKGAGKGAAKGAARGASRRNLPIIIGNPAAAAKAPDLER